MAKPRTPPPGHGFFTDRKRLRRLKLLWAKPHQLSHTAIAKRFGPPCTRNTVAAAIRKYGLPTRAEQEAA